jgi:hypothetical protein
MFSQGLIVFGPGVPVWDLHDGHLLFARFTTVKMYEVELSCVVLYRICL